MSSRKPDTESQLTEELVDLERMLASFEPGASRIDRDRVMFNAGVAHGSACHEREGTRRQMAGSVSAKRAMRWAWPMATAASLLMAGSMGSLYWAERHGDPITAGRSVDVPREVPRLDEGMASSRPVRDVPTDGQVTPSGSVRIAFGAVTVMPVGFDGEYVALRNLVLAEGIDALPERDYGNDAKACSKFDRRPATSRQLMKELLGRPSA